jgi:hypothetical protein
MEPASLSVVELHVVVVVTDLPDKLPGLADVQRSKKNCTTLMVATTLGSGRFHETRCETENVVPLTIGVKQTIVEEIDVEMDL